MMNYYSRQATAPPQPPTMATAVASATSASRSSSGISRLAMMQARFQAQQTIEKEEKLIQMLEHRQDQYTDHRGAPAYNHHKQQQQQHPRHVPSSPSSSPQHSSNSLSSSSSAGGGVGPATRRLENGWERSNYPLKPVVVQQQQPHYRRVASSSNKYSGNYGPSSRRNNNNGIASATLTVLGHSQRGVSLDRASRYYAASQESGYASGAADANNNNMSRTRSHHHLHNLGSSGEPSYASSGRILPPPSRGGSIYSGYSNGYGGIYTREYVRNLPLATAGSNSGSSRGRLLASRSSNTLCDVSPQPSAKLLYDHSSYSSQSSERSSDLPPPLPPARRLQKQQQQQQPTYAALRYSRSQGNLHTIGQSNRIGLTTSATDNDLADYRRKPVRSSRSPDDRSSSRTPSPSPPIRRGRLLSRRNRSSHELRNVEPQPTTTTTVTAVNEQQQHSAYHLFQEQKNFERNAIKEREEEKRRMQAEMLRREQELLERIKMQQKELEAVKMEKTKFARELHRHELLRERERRLSEEKRIEDERSRERHVRREKSTLQMQQQQQQARSAMLASPKKNFYASRSSSMATLDNSDYCEMDEPAAAVTGYDASRRSTSIGRPGMSPVKRRQLQHGPPVLRSETSSGAGEGGGYKMAIGLDEEDGRKPTTPSAIGSAASRNKPPLISAYSVSSPSSPPAREAVAAAAAAAAPTPVRRSLFAPKPRDDLVPCPHCERNFAEDRIERHREICARAAKKKRKTFDMTKKRTQGTDAETFVKRANSNKSPTKAATNQQQDGKKSDWRKKREEFINALRAAKVAQMHVAAGGKLSDLPPPPPMDTSDYIQCPYCTRRFNETVAERHIPRCKDIKSNKR